MSALFREVPLVISYYTVGTPYEEEAKHLVASCARFNLSCQIEGIPDQGSWRKNCAIKPYFLRDKMRQLQRPLLWVDVDAVFLKPMQFEPFMLSDFAILKCNEEDDPRFAVRAGTVYINNTVAGQKGLDLWCHYSDQVMQAKEDCPSFSDQVSLYFVFLAGKNSHVSLLPESYCKIFDHTSPGFCNEETVIEHNQASRRFKI